MVWLCFKLPPCLFGNTKHTSVLHEKSKMCLFYLYATTKSENQICSNKHETGLEQKLELAINLALYEFNGV